MELCLYFLMVRTQCPIIRVIQTFKLVDIKNCTHHIIKRKRAGYANSLRHITSKTIFYGCTTKTLVAVVSG